MSRVGRLPIPIPGQVKVQVQGGAITVEGPKGKLSHELPPELAIEQESGCLRVKRSSDEKHVKSLHGLHRALVSNMVQGVTEGFVKELELVGVGYRAQVAPPPAPAAGGSSASGGRPGGPGSGGGVAGQKLELFVGFTHPVSYPIPAGVHVEVPKPTQVVIRGTDKCLVGQVAARLRAFAPPEPYKGKGIRYAGEVIRRKAGKSVA